MASRRYQWHVGGWACGHRSELGAIRLDPSHGHRSQHAAAFRCLPVGGVHAIFERCALGSRPMRQQLRWTLGGTLLLSAASLWWPQSGPRVIGAVEAVPGAPELGTRGWTDTPQLKAPLPRSLEPLQLEPARRDPFAPIVATAPATVAAPPLKPVVVQEPAVAAPLAAPPLTLRYLGRMVTPDGRPMVLLARGDTAVSVQPGMMLDEGYRVQRVTAEAVHLVYPPTGAEVDIPIPPAPTSP